MATPPNPFTMSDAQIYDEVCLTDRCSSHETYDSASLLNVVENILKQATHFVDHHVLLKSPTPIELVDGNFQAASLDPKFSILKHIACQMQCKHLSEEIAHRTTISVLENLATFSWDAKAVLALAAFAKDYGVFWHLVHSPITDTLAKPLGLLHRVPAIVSQPGLNSHKRAITELNEMVKSILELVKGIAEVEKLSSTNKYDDQDVPHLYDALRHIPTDTYWAIHAIVACSTQMTDSDFKYQLYRYEQKLQTILTQSKDRLHKAINERPPPLPSNSTDVVEFLKALIFDSKHMPHASVFDGSTGQMVSIEVLKKMNVFLFVSGLDKIRDDIVLLTPIYEAITKDKDKKDYKILWLPIVDEWNIERKVKFDYLKKKMPWYVVEYFSSIGHRKHIVERWQYKRKPIVVVLDPKGNVLNANAMRMIFSWGIRAFPFIDDAPLCEQWNWLWSKVLKYPHPEKRVGDNKYIFFYGGDDNVWIDKFTSQLKAIGDNPRTKRADCEIEYFQMGKDTTSFWGDINELFAIHIQKNSDPVIKEVKKFLSFKTESGWALLSKGRNVVIWDYKDTMLKVVEEFEQWKEQVLPKGFDVAFMDYHKIKSQTAPRHCVHLQPENIGYKVPESVKCPDCDHVMDIASVHYRCCHDHAESADADADVNAS